MTSLSTKIFGTDRQPHTWVAGSLWVTTMIQLWLPLHPASLSILILTVALQFIKCYNIHPSFSTLLCKS